MSVERETRPRWSHAPHRIAKAGAMITIPSPSVTIQKPNNSAAATRVRGANTNVATSADVAGPSRPP